MFKFLATWVEVPVGGVIVVIIMFLVIFLMLLAILRYLK